MAQAKCGFCQNTSFELSTLSVANARSSLPILHCATCGAAIGVLQQEDASATARAAAHFLEDQLREIEERLTKKIDDLRNRLPSQ